MKFSLSGFGLIKLDLKTKSENGLVGHYWSLSDYRRFQSRLHKSNHSLRCSWLTGNLFLVWPPKGCLYLIVSDEIKKNMILLILRHVKVVFWWRHTWVKWLCLGLCWYFILFYFLIPNSSFYWQISFDINNILTTNYLSTFKPNLLQALSIREVLS